MRNSILFGGLLSWLNLNFQMTVKVYANTFAYKSQELINQNTGIARAGYDYAAQNFATSGIGWTYTHIRIKPGDSARPGHCEQVSLPGYDEPLWQIMLVDRKEDAVRGILLIGVQTGSTYGLLELATAQ